MPRQKRTTLTGEGNPNPAANIGFLCFTPFHYYLYKNIYRHLPNAEFIIGERQFVPETNTEGELGLTRLVNFLSDRDVHWRTRNPSDRTITAKEFYSKYALLVSSEYHPLLRSPHSQDKKFVRILASYAKESWNFGVWNAYFDLILTYGPYSQNRLAIYGNVRTVGNPKFDDWFGRSVDKKEAMEIRNQPDSKKKTILYLPTYGNLSSLPMMASTLSRLSVRYNVILKAHHNTVLYERNRLAPYRGDPNILMKNDQNDLLPLLKIAHVVISDNSGAIFDAVLADRPVALIDFLSKEMAQLYKEGLYYRSSERNRFITNPQSLEQMVKRPGHEIGSVVDVLTQMPTSIIQRIRQIPPSQLLEALEDVQLNEHLYGERRAKLRKDLFSYSDDRSGKRAADAIKELLYRPKSSRPFLAHALDQYIETIIPVAASEPSDKDTRTNHTFARIRSLPPLQRIRVLYEEFF